MTTSSHASEPHKFALLEQARVNFQEARELINRESDPGFYGVLSHDIGNVHQAAGRMAEAAEEYETAAGCMGLAGKPRDQATALRLAGQIRRKLDQPENALAAAIQAQHVLRTIPELPAHDLAEALVLAADILRKDQPADALPHLQEARQLLAVDGVGTPLEQLAVLEVIRATHIALNATADAQTTLTEAREILAVYTAEVLTGSDVDALLELVDTLVQHEQLTQARAALERAEALLRVESGDTPARRANLTHSIGRAYEALGNRGEVWAFAEARGAYQVALGLLDADAQPGTYGIVLYDLADVQKAEGNLREAAFAYQESAKYKGLANNIKGQAHALRRAGEIHLRIGMFATDELPDSEDD